MSPHDDLHAFADGELAPDQAEAFREHLASCARCQRDLHEVLQLDALAEASTALRQPLATVTPLRPRGPRWVVPAVSLALAASAIFWVQRTRAPDPVAALSGPRRSEARVSWAEGDVWRPYETLRGGQALDAVPLATLATLEARHQPQALAGAWLLAGDAARANALLAPLPPSPDLSADRAAVALAQGRPADALEAARTALTASPTHVRARWNKALAARELGLTALAAESFGGVAAQGEPGWADEARTRQATLAARAAEHQATYGQALNAAARMTLEHVAMPPALVQAAPSLARMNLAYALRTATSKAEFDALRPVAAQLATLLASPAPVESVDRAAAADLRARASLAAGFRKLFARYYTQLAAVGYPVTLPPGAAALTPAEEPAFKAQVLARGTADDLVLALPMLGLVQGRLDDYARAAATLGDPWFTFALANERAKAALAKGDVTGAERAWLEVLRSGGATAPMRVLQASVSLSHLLLDQHRAAEAQRVIDQGLRLAAAQGDVFTEGQLLSLAADAARYRNQRGLAQALLEEAELRQPGTCHVHRYAHESLASLATMGLDAPAARAALTQAASCGEPLTVVGAFELSDLLRLAPDEQARALFQQTMASLREAAASDLDRATCDHLEGRALIDTDPAGGERLLRAAMSAVRDDPAPEARKLVAYGYGLLRSEAGRQQRFADLFTLTAEELGRPLPDGCALVVDVEDDRVAAAARTGAGEVSGAFARVPLTRPHPDGIELPEVLAIVGPLAQRAFASCGAGQALRVYTGFPLNGRSGWLPPDVAWSFASGLTGQRAQPGQTLVVADVEPPAELALPRLAGWDERAAGFHPDVVLRGPQATPEGVLEVLRGAAFVEFDAHGLVNTGSDDTAMLVLSPGPGGAALTAARVGKQTLERHPVVLLAACRAATVAPMMHVSWSLPHAFLQAGASAVLAAPVDLPDGEARAFFKGLIPRVLAGENVPRALQAEQAAWLAAGRGDWVRSVLVFE